VVLPIKIWQNKICCFLFVCCCFSLKTKGKLQKMQLCINEMCETKRKRSQGMKNDKEKIRENIFDFSLRYFSKCLRLLLSEFSVFILFFFFFFYYYYTSASLIVYELQLQ